MDWTDDGRFEGSLAELIERCARFLPSPSVLHRAQAWLLAQIETAREPLLVRRFAPHVRGAVVQLAGAPAFIPVDNEPLIAIFDLLVRQGVPQATLRTLLEAGSIPVSWSVEVDCPGFRCGAAKGELRTARLKLAHLLDCGRGITGGSGIGEEVRVRAFRTLNPVNVFPFPSSRHWNFAFEGLELTTADPAEDPQILSLLGRFVAERLRDEPGAVTTWLERSGVSVERFACVSMDRARSVRVRVSPRSRAVDRAPAPATTPASPVRKDFPETACPKVRRSAALNGMDGLYAHLRRWRDRTREALRLDGRTDASPNGADWAHFSAAWFAPADADLINDRQEQFDGVAFNGIYSIHGDATAAAIDEFLLLYEADQEPRSVFTPALTASRMKQGAQVGQRRCMRLATTERARGFYCYRVGG